MSSSCVLAFDIINSIAVFDGNIMLMVNIDNKTIITNKDIIIFLLNDMDNC